MRHEKLINTILASVLFLFMWFFIFLLACIAQTEGILSILGDAYGNWIFIFGFSMAALIFLSAIYLRFFIKAEWKIQLVCYSMTIIFVITGIFLLHIAESKFIEFTSEKWIQHPHGRLLMYDDLVDSHSLKHYTLAEINQLLGQPDDVGEDGCYVYNDRHGNAVYVEFENGMVSDCFIIE